MTLAYGDLDPTRALPAASYRDPAWLAAETDRIWHGDWVFVTTEDALSTPGDQLPVVVGNQPVLVLRNQSGELAAVSNLCAHRGTLLVEEPTNNKRIQCPYHAWTYDDGGRLLAVPFAQAGAVGTQECAVRTGLPTPRYVRVDSLAAARSVVRQRLIETYPQPDFLAEDKAICERIRVAVSAATSGPAGSFPSSALSRTSATTSTGGSTEVVGVQLEDRRHQRHGELSPFQGPPDHPRAGHADPGRVLRHRVRPCDGDRWDCRWRIGLDLAHQPAAGVRRCAHAGEFRLVGRAPPRHPPVCGTDGRSPRLRRYASGRRIAAVRSVVRARGRDLPAARFPRGGQGDLRAHSARCRR